MASIFKFQRTGNGFKERLIVKEFKYSDDMYKFLNHGDTALHWYEHNEHTKDKPTKVGTYAFAGGQWHNVKKLDASVLAHI